MRAIIIVVICVIVGIGLWFSQSSGPSSNSNVATETGSTTGSTKGAESLNSSPDSSVKGPGTTGSSTSPGQQNSEDGEDGFNEDIQPATAVYKSADEALEAIKKGAVDYDDLILEQFSELGENCSWCDKFYTDVNEMMLASDTNEDAKSYYAEVLAISGRIDNVSNLISAIKNAPSDDDAD
ncbi:MAG: hypothetical protein KDD62_04015, partial [Bdellovibrionales bacterium]|nr:hypothetical protein [Bdellovibrionales bacterium]